MKKLYTLSLTLLTFTISLAQTPIITGIMDGDCPGGNPKAIEIYANGTVNFADYSLENQTNATVGTWTATLNLAPLGTVTNAFVYVILGGNSGGTTPVDNIITFNTEFPGIPAGNILVPPTGTGNPQPLNVNGDDRLRIINASTLAVIDQYGVSDVDGSLSPWEYIDSWAKRNNGTGPDGASFNIANWTFGGVDNSTATPNGALNGLGSCQGGATFSTVVPFGQYTLATKKFDIAGLNVYPNPVKNGNLYITSSNSDVKSVVIYDVLGKQVIKANVTNQAVNVSNLNSGIYIVKITEAGKTATRKLVIE